MSRLRYKNIAKLREVSLNGLTHSSLRTDELFDFTDNAISLRTLATSLSRLVAGLALPSTSYDPPRSADDMEAISNESEVVQVARRAKEWKVQNELGALSWREEDGGKLNRNLTKPITY